MHGAKTGTGSHPETDGPVRATSSHLPAKPFSSKSFANNGLQIPARAAGMSAIALQGRHTLGVFAIARAIFLACFGNAATTFHRTLLGLSRHRPFLHVELPALAGLSDAPHCREDVPLRTSKPKATPSSPITPRHLDRSEAEWRDPCIFLYSCRYASFNPTPNKQKASPHRQRRMCRHRLLFSSCSACFMLVSVSFAPLSIRAISCVRSLSSMRRTSVCVRPRFSVFSIRKCWSPNAAI